MSKLIRSDHVLQNRIAFYRSVFNYTQSDLAFRLGVSVNTISAWETGSSIPTAYNAAILCRVFKVPFESLFGVCIK